MMRKCVHLYLITLLTLLGSAFAQAHEAHCKDTALGATMADMKKPYKALRKAVAANDETLYRSLSLELLRHSEEARNQKPLLVTEQVRDMVNYQKQMDQLIDLLRQLSNSTADLAPALLDKIQELRKRGHKRFRKDCD